MPVLARLAVALLVAPALLAAAAPAPGGPLAPFAAELRAHGVDPAEVLASPVTIEVWLPDGGRAIRVVPTLEQLLEDTGLADVPEVPEADEVESAAGNIAHGYLHLEQGGDALAYRISTSAALPTTPAVMPPSPADLFVFHVGGPVRQVQGTFDSGAHSVGTSVGTNVATGPDGPYLPVLDGGLLGDQRVEFVGYAVIWQGQVCFGEDGDICLGFGGFHGTGVGVWDLQEAPWLPALP